jgi:ADP-ribosylglycohydrolase
MTLFTLEGLICASVRMRSKGICHPPSLVLHAYLRWLHTQGASLADVRRRFGLEDDFPYGWLVSQPFLHHRRAPGNSCLSALEDSLRNGRTGTTNEPINDSKGCGAVMRVAPVGFFGEDPNHAFDLGCEIGALTHGNPSGYLPAGALAEMVWLLVRGGELPEAVGTVQTKLLGQEDHEETSEILARGVRLAGQATPEVLESLGGGWTGHEALAIAVCAALSATDIESGLRMAVNHSGDSDSTGSICGNLLGAAGGDLALPPSWVADLEGREAIEMLCYDAWRDCTGRSRAQSTPVGDTRSQDWWERYPGV